MENKYYFKRCVTLANATEKACSAENGYWKSNVYAFPSMRPNCITYISERKKKKKMSTDNNNNIAYVISDAYIYMY